jgi:hypothetical protein
LNFFSDARSNTLIAAKSLSIGVVAQVLRQVPLDATVSLYTATGGQHELFEQVEEPLPNKVHAICTILAGAAADAASTWEEALHRQSASKVIPESFPELDFWDICNSERVRYTNTGKSPTGASKIDSREEMPTGSATGMKKKTI